MKYNFHYLILLVTVTGCGMLRDTSKTAEADHQLLQRSSDLKVESAHEQIKKGSSVLLFSDSSNQDYTLQVWPKGRFSYSASSGFEGEAEKVLVSGKLKQSGYGSVMSGLEETSKSQTKFSREKQSKMASGRKLTVSKKTVSLKWVIVGVVALLFAVFLFYKLKF